MMQLYVLKLLKIQTKYLGRQWRKSNMKTMSAIYQKVRHRLNDDWAYGNDIDARPWDFQAEECALRESIEKFNSRRYDRNKNGDFTPVDNCLQSVLGQRVELPEDFHYSYEMWLEREVFSQPIQWEGLLQNPWWRRGDGRRVEVEDWQEQRSDKGLWRLLGCKIRLNGQMVFHITDWGQSGR